MNYWSRNLFKGRIGEAVIEAVLAEFGYSVLRAGYEQAEGTKEHLKPDLLVEDPTSHVRHMVEVKYRSARPTSVQLDPKRLKAVQGEFPEAILAFVSAYDGAIYCAALDNIELGQDGNVNLLEGTWLPLWHFFPLVIPGPRLHKLWKDLRATLENYGSRIVSSKPDAQLWKGETDALAAYLESAWEEPMLDLGIAEPKPERLTHEEKWEKAREISAANLALDLFEYADEDRIETNTLQLAMRRALGKRGEGILTIDLKSVARSLGVEEDDRAAVGLIIAVFMRQTNDPKLADLRDRMLSDLPDGIGGVYIIDPSVPFEEAHQVDLKTAIKLAWNPCRIDR